MAGPIPSAPPAYTDVVSPEADTFSSSVPATQVELHISCRHVMLLCGIFDSFFSKQSYTTCRPTDGLPLFDLHYANYFLNRNRNLADMDVFSKSDPSK